jgi:hypothetical protein
MLPSAIPEQSQHDDDLSKAGDHLVADDGPATFRRASLKAAFRQLLHQLSGAGTSNKTNLQSFTDWTLPWKT